MKVGFFDTCLNWIPHFETDLELIEKHIHLGDEVVWFNCHKELPFCQPNPLHKNWICNMCIRRKKKGLKLYKDKIKISNWNKDHSFEIKIPKVSNLKNLKEYKNDQFDIGLATVSSLVSVIRDPNPDMEKHRNIWERAFQSSFITYQNIYHTLQEGRYDLVYLFNGRYAVERAVLRACENLGIKYVVHERGRNKDYYMLYENALPHNRVAWLKRMKEAWENNVIPMEKKAEIGKSFYIDRTKGKEEFWVSFVHGMKEGLLPDNFNQNATNITIFSSSEDEMMSISDEWRNPVYDSQIEGIKKIMKDAPNNIQFYLRLHPNLTGIRNKDIEEMESLQFNNLIVIPASSKVNSYSLIKASDKVISFGSTVGVEATYWGTPSILAGASYFRGTGVTYDANSHQEVIELIKKTLKPKDVKPALMYGYYLKTFGFEFKNYKGINFYIGKYKGKFLYGNILFFGAMRILSLFRILGSVKRLIKKILPYSERISRSK